MLHANTDPIAQKIANWHPLTLVAKATSEDTPSWSEDTNGHNSN